MIKLKPSDVELEDAYVDEFGDAVMFFCVSKEITEQLLNKYCEEPLDGTGSFNPYYTFGEIRVSCRVYEGELNDMVCELNPVYDYGDLVEDGSNYIEINADISDECFDFFEECFNKEKERSKHAVQE